MDTAPEHLRHIAQRYLGAERPRNFRTPDEYAFCIWSNFADAYGNNFAEFQRDQNKYLRRRGAA